MDSSQTTTATMAESHPLALPSTLSPDTLDVLTHLSTMLTEVRTNLQATTGLDADNATDKKDDAAPSTTQGLTFKDVARASDGVKHKLQRAREQVHGLPDMARGIPEQEQEIQRLEARIVSQTALLKRLRDERGAAASRNDGDGNQMEM